MAISFFENTEWSSATYNLTAVLNVTGVVRFLSTNIDFIFQRTLIAYSLTGFYTTLPNSIKIPMEFTSLELIIQEPANVAANLELGLSFPVGGTELLYLSNRVTLPGNTNQVSFLSIPVKKFNFEISMHDAASAGNALTSNLTIWWETKKREKFVGED